MSILTTEPTRVTGERRISFEWVLQSPRPNVTQVATLSISHDKQRGILSAFFSRDWREQRGSGWRHSVEVGGPGVSIPPWPIQRFSAKRLEEYAGAALAAIRSMTDDEKVIAVLTPSDRSCGCGIDHEAYCPVYVAEVDAKRAKRNEDNAKAAALRTPARRAAQPDWLYVRVNDSYGTDNNHAFWTTVEVVKIGNWKLFEKDGAWFGYDTQYNAWAQFKSEAEAKAHATGGSVDVWA